MAAFISFRNCKMAAFMYLMRNFHGPLFQSFDQHPLLRSPPFPLADFTLYVSASLSDVDSMVTEKKKKMDEKDDLNARMGHAAGFQQVGIQQTSVQVDDIFYLIEFRIRL